MRTMTQTKFQSTTITTILLVIINIGTIVFCLNSSPILDEIRGYHFHTYFFQTNTANTEEAMVFRSNIQAAIDSGTLSGCRLNHVNMVPRGPHTIGSYETCCNKTAISPALSWFMQNHQNLSVLLHPLTRYEIEDHTERAMFLGQKLPLDISALQADLGDNIDLCLPISQSTSSTISNHSNNAQKASNQARRLSDKLRTSYFTFF